MSNHSQKKALIIAPHPDDDVIGMGGKIALYAKDNWKILVIFVTNSRGIPGVFPQKTDQEMFDIRKKEAQQALATINKNIKTKFLECLSKDLAIKDKFRQVVTKITNIVSDFNPSEVYVTSPIEKHPTHLRCTEAILEALRCAKKKVKFYGYEIWTAMLPLSNITVCNIDAVKNIKKQAIACHQSQCQFKAYHQSSLAKNRFNAVNLESHGKDQIKYVELFWDMSELLTNPQLTLEQYRQEQISNWLKSLKI